MDFFTVDLEQVHNAGTFISRTTDAHSAELLGHAREMSAAVECGFVGRSKAAMQRVIENQEQHARRVAREGQQHEENFHSWVRETAAETDAESTRISAQFNQAVDAGHQGVSSTESSPIVPPEGGPIAEVNW